MIDGQDMPPAALGYGQGTVADEGARAGARTKLSGALTGGALLREWCATRTVYGTFVIELPTPRAIRALALAGFEFVVLDLEHSVYDVGLLGTLATEAQLVGMPVIARVWTADAGLIGKVLDAGANGVMVPHVRDARMAQDAVLAARFAPVGVRGMAPLISYGASESQLALGESTIVVVQIEGREAIENCDEIAAVPGIDAVFIGTYDLSQAIGAAGQVGSAVVLEAASRVAARCAHLTTLGIYVDDAADSKNWSSCGFRLQCISFDGRILLRGAEAVIAEARDQHVPQDGVDGS